MPNPMDPMRREAILELARRQAAMPPQQYQAVPQPPITMDLTQDPPPNPYANQQRISQAGSQPAQYRDEDGNIYPVQTMDFGEQDVPGLTRPQAMRMGPTPQQILSQEVEAPVDRRGAILEAMQMSQGRGL